MAIIAADGFKISKTNTPTREGERIATIADITNREKVPNPFVGMLIFVEDEQAHYTVLELGSDKIGGIEVPNVVVGKYKKVEVEDGSISKKKLSSEVQKELETLSKDAAQAKIAADKAAADIGVDSTTLLQGGIDSDGKENASSYYLRTGRCSTFKLEVNDGYTVGQIAQYDLVGNFVALYSDYTQSLEGVEWTPTSVVATDKDYMWVAVVFKGNSPSTPISPREAVVKTFVSGLHYYMQGGEGDANSAAAQAKTIVNRTIEQLPNTQDLVLVDEKMQLANRAAAVKDGKVASLGYVILRPDKSFAEQVKVPNTIYEIKYAFDVGGTTDNPVVMPANSILRFTGGRLDNGVIRMTRGTNIDAGAVTIFGRNLNILYPWFTVDKFSHLYPEWYDGTDQERLQWAIDLVAGTAENLNRGESPVIWLTEAYTITDELRCFPKDIDFPNKEGVYRTFINIEGADPSRSIIYVANENNLANKPIFNCTGMNRSSFKNFRIQCYPTSGSLPYCAIFVCRKADNHNAGNNMFERLQFEGNFVGQSVMLVGSESNMFLECSLNYYLHEYVPNDIISDYYMPTPDTKVSGGTTRNIFVGGASKKTVIGSATNSTLFVGGYSYNNGIEFIADTAEIDFINFRQEADSNFIAGVTVKEGVTINNINFWGGNLMGIVGEKGSTIRDCNFSAKTTSLPINNYNVAYSEKYQDSQEYLITSEDRAVCIIADKVINSKFNPYGGTVKIINPVYNEILGTNGASIGDSIYRTMTPPSEYIPGVITNGVYDKPIWDFYKQLKVGVLGFDYEIIDHTTVSKLNLNFAKPSVKIVNLSANVNGLNVTNNLAIHDKRNTMVLIHFVQDSVGGRAVYEFYNNDITRKLDIDPRPKAVTSVLIYHTTSPLKNYIIPLNYKNISTTDEINSYKDKIKNFKGYKVYNSDTGNYCYAGKEGLREIMSIPYGAKTTGITDERPTGISTGFLFFDTSLSKPIWWNGTVWVDSTGTEV